MKKKENTLTGFRYLAQNVLLLTIGTFGTKLLTFFLVPLYTSILSTEDYGNYDLVNTTVQLMIPFLTLKIDEAVMRFAMDKDVEQADVFTIGLKHVLRGSIIVCLLVLSNHLLGIFDVIDRYSGLFIVMYVLTALSNLLIMFVRGLERISDISIAGVLSSLASIICNIIFLVPFHMGLLGYFLASVTGLIVSVGYLFFVPKCWKYMRPWNGTDSNLDKQMVKYSTPMIANAVSWWINNASDRYIVTWLCGIAANGIYSVAYKIPSILNILQSIFLQAWTISAVKDFDPEDKSGFFSKMYNSYNFLMVISCSGLILLDKPIAKYLYANEFFAAWEYVPFLMISIVFGAMSGYIGGVFSAVKNSRIYAVSTTVGAIVNTIFNVILVNLMGPIGAAIATTIGYCVVWLMRLHYMKQYIHMRLYMFRDYTAYGLLVVQSILLIRMNGGIMSYAVQGAILILIALLFKREIKFASEKVLSVLKRKC